MYHNRGNIVLGGGGWEPIYRPGGHKGEGVRKGDFLHRNLDKRVVLGTQPL